ncbi:unnamed protein product, partial [Polarella glacialis]
AVRAAIKLFPSGTPGLVYCITRKEAESVCSGLSEGGVPCAYYHGDLDPAARQRVHSSWMEGRVSVVVATVAFGMGINKCDVRFVIHFGLPASLHHYYQEAGRAGRDGNPALCLLLYRPTDVTRHSVMNYYKPASLRELYGTAMYCQGRGCRRVHIAQHFGEELPPCEAACDVCWANSASSSARGTNSTTLPTDGEPPPAKKRRSDGANPVASAARVDRSRCPPPADAWRRVLEVISEARGSEEQLTLAKLGDKLQKACKWRGEEASDDAMFVIVSLLGAGYLREEFRHSPYSTNAYLVGTPSADRVLAGQEEVPAAARELGTPSPLLHSPVVLGPVESAARAAATLRAGGSSPGADRAQHAAVARRLQKLRVSLGQRFGVPGQYILSDEEVAALAAMPAIPASPGALKPLCAVKRRLYGQAVLVSLRDEALPQVAADAIDL